jgi:hypothetical protein
MAQLAIRQAQARSKKPEARSEKREEEKTRRILYWYTTVWLFVLKTLNNRTNTGDWQI